jgi:hypothetical protein
MDHAIQTYALMSFAMVCNPIQEWYALIVNDISVHEHYIYIYVYVYIYNVSWQRTVLTACACIHVCFAREPCEHYIIHGMTSTEVDDTMYMCIYMCTS